MRKTITVTREKEVTMCDRCEVRGRENSMLKNSGEEHLTFFPITNEDLCDSCVGKALIKTAKKK